MHDTTDHVGHHELDDRDVAMLDLERHWFTYSGAKDTIIRERFGFTSVRYYQLLNHLIDQPAALAHDPLVVRRLRRLRTQRAQHRAAIRATFD